METKSIEECGKWERTAKSIEDFSEQASISSISSAWTSFISAAINDRFDQIQGNRKTIANNRITEQQQQLSNYDHLQYCETDREKEGEEGGGEREIANEK